MAANSLYHRALDMKAGMRGPGAPNVLSSMRQSCKAIITKVEAWVRHGGLLRKFFMR